MPSTTPNEAVQLTPPLTLRDALHVMLAHAGTLKEHSSNEFIHAARKEMKRARAALRLMRPMLGDEIYRSANRQVRDAARLLTPLRDATVLVDALKRLRRPKDQGTDLVCANQLDRLLAEELRSSQLTAESLTRSAAKLRQVDRRIRALPAQESQLETASRGIQKVYKAGRKAMARAQRRGDTHSLHEWRKQAQYLAHQAELVGSVFHVKLEKIGRRSRELAQLLGEDHDLALLGQKIRDFHRGERLAPSGGAYSRFKKRIKRRRLALQTKAYRLGKRLYARSAPTVPSPVKPHSPSAARQTLSRRRG